MVTGLHNQEQIARREESEYMNSQRTASKGHRRVAEEKNEKESGVRCVPERRGNPRTWQRRDSVREVQGAVGRGRGANKKLGVKIK